MNSHLSEEQLVASALGDFDRATALHLEACVQCREETRSLNGALAAWVEDVREGPGTSEVFWAQQRESIAARLARRPWLRPWQRLAWAGATVTLVLLAGLLIHRQPTPSVNHPPVDDNTLLLSVHASVNREVPRALQPLTLLTQEIDRAEETRRAVSE